MMEPIILLCGVWRFDQGCWSFEADASSGCKMMQVTEDVRYEDFLCLVHEDFGIDRDIYTVKLSFVSTDLMNGLPHDTPPIVVTNARHLRGFLELSRKSPMRLCVEKCRRSHSTPVKVGKKVQPKGGVFLNSSGESSRQDSRKGRVNRKMDPVESAVEEDAEIRFDYCDDVDGASSSDEDCIRIVREMKIEDKSIKMHELPKAEVYFDNELMSFQLVVGQCYPTKAELQTRLKALSVLHRFDFDIVASTKWLYVAKCCQENCSWRLRAVRDDPADPCFHIRQLTDEHTCSITVRSSRARQATPDVLGRLYLDFIGSVGRSVTPLHVSEALCRRFGLQIVYWKAHRTLKVARSLVSGSPESSYEDLPSYMYRIRQANPGTFINLEVDQLERFKFIFFAFDACIRGFRYMRKVVVVDGTFLKGKYKGTLLTATMQDGNFNIFPIAFGVVDGETDEAWQWFFRQLHRVIPDDKELAIISDRHQSIANAITTVYPLASRGVCTYHMRKNILARFKGGEGFKLFKRAATAYRVEIFDAILNEIEAVDPRLHAYLKEAEYSLWSRVHFPGSRYNFTTSNIAESLNNALSEARSFPIVHLIDAIRAMLTRWFANRRAKAGSTTTILSNSVEKIIKGRIVDTNLYNVQVLDEHQALVSRVSSANVVNLLEKTCSCKRFDLEKIPCVHAIAAAEAMRRSIVDLTDPYYYTTALRHAYRRCVMPSDAAIPVPDRVAAKVCRPPVVRNQPGRPRKSRVRSWFECSVQGKEKRPRKESTCSICQSVGHNSRSCEDGKNKV